MDKIIVNNSDIRILKHNDEDYICITDMLQEKDGEFFVTDWLRNANTLDFLEAWETMHNGNDFNYGEFAIIRSKSGSNSHKISVKDWVKKTNAIGIIAKPGRYGGTFAHKDIAFEFGTWISPAFKLYLIKEYQRLKLIEQNPYNLEWSVNRVLASVNLRLQTDAIKEVIIPHSKRPDDKKWLHYAEEADILNVAVWGYTKREWSELNPELALKNKNPRDYASINELLVISRLETINDDMIRAGRPKEERYDHLKETAKRMLTSLDEIDIVKSVRKLTPDTYQQITQGGGDIKKLK